MEGRVPTELAVPTPSDDSSLRDDEDPLDYDVLPLDAGDDCSEPTPS
jgi:hypothetical protein